MNTPPRPGDTVAAFGSTGTVEAVFQRQRERKPIVFVRWPKGDGMWVPLDEIEEVEP